MINDFANQNADILIKNKEEKQLTNTQLWFSRIAILSTLFLGTAFLVQGNTVTGITLYVFAWFVWWTLK